MRDIKFKGTQGSWHYQKDADVYTHIVRPDNNPGAIILYGRQYSSEVNKADLTLAAAAPDLLAILIKAQESYEKYGHLLKFEASSIQLVINKALGITDQLPHKG